MKFEFEELKLNQEGNRFQRLFKSAETKRTFIAVAIGAIAGFAYFYFTEGQRMETLPAKEVFKNMAIGAFFGFFITNSPCARGKC